jgi:hypothetical protein
MHLTDPVEPLPTNINAARAAVFPAAIGDAVFDATEARMPRS